jgi:hypothetical protein
MTRNDIIRNTATEITALHDQDALDESVVELLLQSMALEIDNLAFIQHMASLDRALKTIGGRA